jgi:hypothetical protein
MSGILILPRRGGIYTRAAPHNPGAQIAQSEFSSDWPKTAGNTLCITEDFGAI